MRGQGFKWTLVLLLTLLMAGLYTVYPRFVEELEDRTLDLRFWIRGTRPPDPELAIVAIDEKSLRELGRWPWSRTVQAGLIDRVKKEGARLIGLDLFYSESESPEADARLARSLRDDGPVVIGLPFVVPVGDDSGTGRGTQTGEPSEQGRYPDFLDRSTLLRVEQVSSGKTFRVREASDSLTPVEPIGPSAAALGHVYAQPERDGILRREMLVVGYQGELFPSLALQLARLALGRTLEETVLRVGEGIRLGDRFVPTDEYGRMLIDYYGKEATFPYYSAADVIAERIPPGEFKGKIVMVGTSALGTYDLKVTPFSNNYPGVEKNATVLSNILRGDHVVHSGFHKAVDLLTILLIGIGLGGALLRIRGIGGTVLALGLLAVLCLWLQGMFAWKGWWLNAVVPVGTLILVYTGVTADRYLTEERKAREIRAMFSSYVSPKIVEELVRHPEKARLGGERRELTVLFSDIRGFTTFSERYAPEEVVATLNEYLKTMTDVIFRWDGTLDKFVGDAIMVFWGAPLDQPNHAELAVRCALHMRRELERLQEKWRGEGKPVLEAGIGINTGEAIVGNIGAAGKKMDYTVIGDHVNLASRVEGLTRKFDAPILITKHTFGRISGLLGGAEGRGRLGHIGLKEEPLVEVKGKAEKLTVYEVSNLPSEDEGKSN